MSNLYSVTNTSLSFFSSLHGGQRPLLEVLGLQRLLCGESLLRVHAQQVGEQLLLRLRLLGHDSRQPLIGPVGRIAIKEEAVRRATTARLTAN